MGVGEQPRQEEYCRDAAGGRGKRVVAPQAIEKPAAGDGKQQDRSQARGLKRLEPATGQVPARGDEDPRKGRVALDLGRVGPVGGGQADLFGAADRVTLVPDHRQAWRGGQQGGGGQRRDDQAIGGQPPVRPRGGDLHTAYCSSGKPQQPLPMSDLKASASLQPQLPRAFSRPVKNRRTGGSS